MGLFNNSEQQIISIEDGELHFWESCLTLADSDSYFQQLLQELDWQQDHLTLGKRVIPIPRLQAWYGDANTTYTYSGLTMNPKPWTDTLKILKNRCEELAGKTFNSVLANQYRDGNDSVSWHADDEPELGHNPVIASLSLGDSRTFQLKHQTKKHLPTQKLELTHGSLLIMKGETQHHWKHQIAKTKRVKQPRINLTFRYVATTHTNK